jgi:hypothetical protein
MARRKGHGSIFALSQHGSTARLLNLALVARRSARDRAWSTQPFFNTPVLNASLLVKHNVRSHEQMLFPSPPYIATKVIVPFDRDDLELGGRTIFVGQKGWREQLTLLADGAPGLARDFDLLEVLDELPSLDPFLVREHIGRRGYQVAPCYLAIAPGDVERMQRSVAGEMEQLIGLAFRGVANPAHTAKMVKVLLTNDADAALEPLRITLKLEGDAYKEGIFCWKGFLYYKWLLDDLRLPLARVRSQVRMLRASSDCDHDQQIEIQRSKARLIGRIDRSEQAATAALQMYDAAFLNLVRDSNPLGFRDFLLRSPGMFLSLGACVGGVSHITSYWNYRFKDGAPGPMSTAELMDILSEFHASLPAQQDFPAAA